jgi:hypothetical protein
VSQGAVAVAGSSRIAAGPRRPFRDTWPARRKITPITTCSPNCSSQTVFANAAPRAEKPSAANSESPACVKNSAWSPLDHAGARRDHHVNDLYSKYNRDHQWREAAEAERRREHAQADGVDRPVRRRRREERQQLPPRADMHAEYSRPEAGDGMAQAFRRSASDKASDRFALRGIDASATYAVTDLDDGSRRCLSGARLTTGLDITLPSQRQAKIVRQGGLPVSGGGGWTRTTYLRIMRPPL